MTRKTKKQMENEIDLLHRRLKKLEENKAKTVSPLTGMIMGMAVNHFMPNIFKTINLTDKSPIKKTKPKRKSLSRKTKKEMR